MRKKVAITMAVAIIVLTAGVIILRDDKVCGYMSLDMMNRHQRLLCGVSDSLCRRNAHEKRAHKTRSVGHSDGCDLI